MAGWKSLRLRGSFEKAVSPKGSSSTKGAQQDFNVGQQEWELVHPPCQVIARGCPGSAPRAWGKRSSESPRHQSQRLSANCTYNDIKFFLEGRSKWHTSMAATRGFSNISINKGYDTFKLKHVYHNHFIHVENYKKKRKLLLSHQRFSIYNI